MARAAQRALERPLTGLTLRSLHRYLAINGTERALVLAGQAFTAFIPLLIVVSTAVASHGGRGFSDALVQRFHLTGNAADAVDTLFSRPPGAVETVSIGSAVLLVLSGLSLSRTIQRLYEAVWQLPPRGLRGAFGGVGALALLLTQILLLSLLTGFFRSVPAGSAILFVLRSAASTGLWLVLQHLLLGGRIGWRPLLPGAVVSGVGQQGVTQASTLWVSHIIERNATRYGAIGVSFAMVSWLVLICIVLVIAAAVSGELGGAPAPPTPVTVTASRPLLTLAQLLGASGSGDGDDPEPGGSRARPDADTPSRQGSTDGPAENPLDGSVDSSVDSSIDAGQDASGPRPPRRPGSRGPSPTR